MEVNLFSRFKFESACDATFAFSMLSASNDTPYSIDDVKKEHVEIFNALENIDFSQDAQIDEISVDCEWTFFSMSDLSAHLEAFGRIKKSDSFHFVSTDDEDPAFLVTIVDTKKQKFDEWNEVAIDEWNAIELFAEMVKASQILTGHPVRQAKLASDRR